MKKQFLLLPLIAILVACNKGTTNNDIFTKARKSNKVTEETKQTVYSGYDTVHMSVSCKVETTQATREKGGEWEESPIGSSISFHNETVCVHNDDGGECYLKETYNYGSSAETSTVQFKIVCENGTYSFEEGVGEGGWYIEDPKKCYQTVFDSFHSWNVSFFAGATELLASIAGTSYMPQYVLNKFAKNFELVEEKPGDFYIDKKEECLYKTSQVEYLIDEYMVVYEDYLLSGYTNRFSVTIYQKEGKTETKMTISYNFQLAEIFYYFA